MGGDEFMVKIIVFASRQLCVCVFLENSNLYPGYLPLVHHLNRIHSEETQKGHGLALGVLRNFSFSSVKTTKHTKSKDYITQDKLNHSARLVGGHSEPLSYFLLSG